jgi:hypothetical protein
MTEYQCNECNMSVKGLQCGKCDAPLQPDKITADNGKEVQVAKCPNDCGKIKSPMCCGHDMAIKH